MKKLSLMALTERKPLPLNLDLQYDGDSEVPVINPVSSVLQLLPLSNTFPPAKRTNCFVIGDAPNNIVAIDPSPCDENEYQKLKRTISKYPIDFIFLTHHHPDHHEFSTVLVRELVCRDGDVQG